MRHTQTRLLLAVIACVVVLFVACSDDSTKVTPSGGATAESSAAGRASAVATLKAGSGAKPNVLFVLTDDMRIDDLQFLPQVRALIGEKGMTFDSEFDNVTLCCPARTSILRGQYSHNTGVLSNGGSNGGFEKAYASKVESATVATAMKGAGYTTGLFGKYLNGYPNTAGSDYVPPGWDTWSSSTKGNAYGEYNYTLNENGKQVQYGNTPVDYGTDVYMRETKDFMTKAAASGKPFFAYLAVYAPHQPATPAPQDTQAFPGLQAPRDPAFNEADVSDKPQYIQDLRNLGPVLQRNIDNLYRKRAQSLQAVDRGVAGLIDALSQGGQLDNTYIIFTSDNGFHLGQHRMLSGKQTAYETDIHLPLMVRGPGVAAGAHVAAITGNIDLAPTIAAIGGAKLEDNPDGRSLMPFLNGKPSNSLVAPPSPWRQAYLLEHWDQTAAGPDRAASGQLEPDDPDQGGVTPGDEAEPSPTAARPGLAALAVKIPDFQGLRLGGYTYVEYVTGEKELYDLTKDPDELTNLAKTASPAMLNTLHQRLEDLRKCAGDACRTAEDKALTLNP